MMGLDRLAGWLSLRVEGAGLERFLNVCRRRRAAVWDIRRRDAFTLTCRVRPATLKLLRQERRRMGCRVTVLEKAGLPFTLEKLRRRWTLPLAVLIFSGLLLWSTTRIWSISVEGCETVPEQTVLDLAESCGFRVGARRTDRTESERIRHTVLQSCHKLSFFTINYHGSHAAIQVRERDDWEPTEDPMAPCDLVSDKAGLVEDIFITEGTAQVKEGDAVVPGTLLSSAAVTSAFGEERLVHAQGEVLLRTWQRVELRLPDAVQSRTPTGRSCSRWSLILGKKRINLYFIEKSPYPCYDKIIENRRLELGDGYWLPIRLRREQILELEPQPLALSPEKCRELLEQRCLDILLTEPGRQVVEHSFALERKDGGFAGILKAQCLEKAGIQTPHETGKES